jgi:radical SAM superfamily enzyme YgiQ (UPF0313 family)
MKILLVYLVVDSPQNTGYNYGLGYIAAVLKEANHGVDYAVIKNKNDVDNYYEKVRNEKPDIIAFSITTSQFFYLKNIVKVTRDISESFILCGGVHPTLRPECIYDVPELDAIVRGEGEYPLLELANALRAGGDYLNTGNFWFRNGEDIIKNEIRPLIQDIDELPLPDKDCVDYQKIINEAKGINRFIFSRGCPFHCAYCSNKALSSVYPNPHNYFRQRSPEKAIEEIEIDDGKYSFEYIVFDDDTISLNKEWFYSFFNLYKKRFAYPFRCNLRVGTVDSDMMKLLKEAGAKGIGIGIEHGNEEFRRKVLKRNISDRQIIDTFELCDKYGISHNDFIMVGFPFETKELFLDTVRLCRKVSAKGRAGIFQPYPGTDLSNVCEKNDWLPETASFREREESVIDYPMFSKEDIQLCHDVFPYLMRYKFISLKIPLTLVLYPFKFINSTKKVVLFIPRKIKRMIELRNSDASI